MFLCYSSYLLFSHFIVFLKSCKEGYVPIVYIWDLSCLVSVSLSRWDGQVWLLPHLVSPLLHGHSQRGVWGLCEVHWECKRCMHSPALVGQHSVWLWLHNRFICRFGVIREEVAIICVRNFLLTEGKVYKSMFIPVLFYLVLMFCWSTFICFQQC